MYSKNTVTNECLMIIQRFEICDTGEVSER